MELPNGLCHGGERHGESCSRAWNSPPSSPSDAGWSGCGAWECWQKKIWPGPKFMDTTWHRERGSRDGRQVHINYAELAPVSLQRVKDVRGGSWVTVNLSKPSFFTTPSGSWTETEVVTCQAGPAVKNRLMLIWNLRFICLCFLKGVGGQRRGNYVCKRLRRMVNLQTPQSTTQSCPAASGAVA